MKKQLFLFLLFVSLLLIEIEITISPFSSLVVLFIWFIFFYFKKCIYIIYKTLSCCSCATEMRYHFSETFTNLMSSLYMFSANLAKTVDQLGTTSTSFPSELDGHPPIWITIKKGTYHDDIYINNARLITRESNFQAKNKAGKEQVCVTFFLHRSKIQTLCLLEFDLQMTTLVILFIDLT